jgi:hypothetical protein
LTNTVYPKGTKREGSRIARGITLYRDHAEEIADIGDDFFLVPSSEPGRSYVVDLEREVCDCPDRTKRCKHVTAATLYRAKQRESKIRTFLRALLSECIVCGTRESDEFVTVGDDHLTFFEGDELCSGCAQEHGVA